jgi:hypothetical protein
MKKTYDSFMDGKWKSIQKEYTEDTPMFDENGNLLAAGWARHDVFDYNRNLVKDKKRRKEWDFYQLSNGRFMVQLSFANIQLGGYISAVLVDLQLGKVINTKMSVFLGGGDKYVLPPKGDVVNNVKGKLGRAHFEFDTKATRRSLYFKMDEVELNFTMDMFPDHENITTLIPFAGKPDKYFMTIKQNCMPCEGTYRIGADIYDFSKDDTFCVLDWGRVNAPYSMVWYWGNGSTYVTDEKGKKHILGFEITWGIGDESNATETCIFYDGKAHKFGAVDVETFPKPDKYMEPWHFVSEDGRFDMTMTPFYDHHADTNALVMRMNSHQVHGLWNGTMTLDDGTKIEVKDMYAFCEYVENRW